MYPLLENIKAPDDVKMLDMAELSQLASEIREFMVNTVSGHGGHLASSLGTVELTLALLQVFSVPEDKIVWDVGHQAYAYKILTGRRERFATLRQLGGITGFPNRSESEYDAFGVGHASTSISAALGMAIARDLRGSHEHIVAVIGDGAMTGGLAMEALNHAGSLHKRMIVILNDNEMSIDENVGAISDYLSRLRSLPQYNRVKHDMGTLLQSIPHIGGAVYKTAGRLKDGVRAAIVPGSLFENLGFHYIGPIDGHNIRLLRTILADAVRDGGPVLIHIHTKKGKGYLPAEQEPCRFHGIGKFDVATGHVAAKSGPVTYTQVFSQTMIKLAAQDEHIVGITAAMPTGTGLKAFGKAYPERFFDVGIAEEHAVTLAAGLATMGIHPVVALYSTFAQRAYDELMHDVCLQKLPVTLCLDRAGLVGADGPTHHGVFDLSFLRAMPGMTIFVPKDEEELRHMLYTAVRLPGPTAVRYPRGAGRGVDLTESFHEIPVGRAEVISDVEAPDVALLAVGTMIGTAVETAGLLQAQGISAAVVNMRFVKPLDTEMIDEYAARSRMLVTLEENVLAGGFGSAIAEYMADQGINKPLLRIGLPDEFIEQGSVPQLYELTGLQPERIAGRIAATLAPAHEKGGMAE